MSAVLMDMWTNFIKTGNPGDFWQTAQQSDKYLRLTQRLCSLKDIRFDIFPHNRYENTCLISKAYLHGRYLVFIYQMFRAIY